MFISGTLMPEAWVTAAISPGVGATSSPNAVEKMVQRNNN